MASSRYCSGVSVGSNACGSFSGQDLPEARWSHCTTVKNSSQGRWKVQEIGSSGAAGPPCTNSRMGLSRSLPRTETYWRGPLISATEEASMALGGAVLWDSPVLARGGAEGVARGVAAGQAWGAGEA